MSKSTGNKRGTRFDRAITIFKKHGGLLRTSQALRSGIHPTTIYAMRDAGTLETVSRGVFRLAVGMPPLSDPDLVTVSMRIPSGVICLISALSFHGLTTRIPHEIHVALPKGAEEPRLAHPPIKAYRFTGKAYEEGIITHEIDGVRVRLYTPEKTLADCFKFRNKIGLDTAMEALRFYLKSGKVRIDELMRFADICRVTKIIRPYLEALL